MVAGPCGVVIQGQAHRTGRSAMVDAASTGLESSSRRRPGRGTSTRAGRRQAYRDAVNRLEVVAAAIVDDLDQPDPAAGRPTHRTAGARRWLGVPRRQGRPGGVADRGAAPRDPRGARRRPSASGPRSRHPTARSWPLGDRYRMRVWLAVVTEGDPQPHEDHDAVRVAARHEPVCGRLAPGRPAHRPGPRTADGQEHSQPLRQLGHGSPYPRRHQERRDRRARRPRQDDAGRQDAVAVRRVR